MLLLGMIAQAFAYTITGAPNECFIVTRDGCPYSQRARVFLRSKGISFKDYNVDAEGADIRPLLIAKWPTFPAVFCGDKIVGGMEELGALEFEN